MKLVREFLDFKRTNFERSGNPLRDMRLGQKARISQWLDMMDVEDYEINDDFSIDVNNDVNLVGLEIEELPDFIDFGKIRGGFYAGGNPWQSLDGFPKEVQGDLQINSPSSPVSPGKRIRNFKENIIRKIIKVDGKIWI